MSLSKKLVLSFAFTILLSIAIISLISNYMINNRFEGYLENEQSIRFENIHKDINQLIVKNNFNLSNMELMHYTINENINLIIKNNDGIILYDSSSRMDHGMGMGRNRKSMMNRIPEGNYTEKEYELLDGNAKIGSLVIGYIDNSYLTDSAIIFKDTLTRSLIASGLFAVTIGIIVSIILSRGMTKPLINITNTANKIRNGNLKAKANVDTNTVEIVELADTINYLGDTLSKQDHIRKRYASDISHELRTPITTLKTHLEAIMDRVWEPNQEHLNILMKEVTRLSGLVDDLSDSFTQDGYSMEINKVMFNLSSEVENIIISYSPIFENKGFILKHSVDKDIHVLMDKDKFNQILNNLLTNSLRYINDSGEVYIGLTRLKNSIRLIVKDNGIGIRKENLSHIFERFYRVDTSRNKATGGSGLGLSIVKSLIEAHNGSISVKSIFGEGTEFEIILPIE